MQGIESGHSAKPQRHSVLAERKALGSKPDVEKSGRATEAKRVTALMRERPGFSYVRLGDYDVAVLLTDESEWRSLPFAPDNRASGTLAQGGPGLRARDVERLRQAVRNASYIDFYERQWRDPSILEPLKAARGLGREANPDAETSMLLGTWLETEFRGYCESRRVLFCGAEAGVLRWLVDNSQTLRGSPYWPEGAEIHTLVPLGGGKNLSDNLDAIKGQIAAEVRKTGVDTVFLSLGGAAKIICSELAPELGVCFFDLGVGLRALTYCASTGHRPSRATHHIFLHRLPFAEVTKALDHAFPDEGAEQRLARAHAQLLLEVQTKEVGWSHSAWENDLNLENMRAFQAAYRLYRYKYRPQFRVSKNTVKERRSFLHFCGKENLTIEGKLFYTIFRCKSFLSSIFKLNRMRLRS
jgi:hypothetical protein